MSDEIHGCEYYIVGAIPVMVVLDDKGRYMGARIPDRDTGSLKKSALYLGYAMDDGVEIDEDRFSEACEAFYNAQTAKG